MSIDEVIRTYERRRLPLRYDGSMTAKKFTISMAPELYAELERQALADRVTVSAWIAEAVEHKLGLAAMDEAIAAYEAEHGAFTPDEIAETAAEMDAAVRESYERAANRLGGTGESG
jgi:hypothetical protein